MKETPQPGNRREITISSNPVGGGERRGEKTSIGRVLTLILAGMGPLLVQGDTRPHEAINSPSITAVEPVPPNEVLVPKEEIETTKNRLREALMRVKSPEQRARVAMLNPHTSLKEACRAVSDWMIQQSTDLDAVWTYLYARKDVWPPYLKNDFDTMIADMQAIPGSPSDLAGLDAKTHARLVQKQPLKCGMGVWLASFVTKTEDVQQKGIGIVSHIVDFFVEDLGTSDVHIQRRALTSAQSLTSALEHLVPRDLNQK